MTEVMYSSWDQGQRQLAAGKYLAARELLQAAEAAAWELRDAASLGRIYLPLLESRRLIRYLAAEGRIEILEHELVMRADPGIEERLVLIKRGTQTRLASPAAADFESGLVVQWTASETVAVGASTDAELVVPLPLPGIYDGRRGLGSVARESIVVAWEALALKWQGRNPLLPGSEAWGEIGWLRRALEVDPACEPVAMRLMAVAEGIERGKQS